MDFVHGRSVSAGRNLRTKAAILCVESSSRCFCEKVDVYSLRRQAQGLTGPSEGNEEIKELVSQVKDLAEKQKERKLRALIKKLALHVAIMLLWRTCSRSLFSGARVCIKV